MLLFKQGSPLYGHGIYFDADGKSVGSGEGDQTNWKVEFEKLKTQIDSGQYVASASYITLQKNLEKAVNEKKNADTALEDVRSQLVLKESALGDLTKKVGDLQTTNQELSQTKATVEKQLQRSQTIFKDFPELATFEADNLLPSAETPEELATKLAAFKLKVGAIGEQKQQSRDQNSTNPPQSKDDKIAPKAKDLLEEAKQLSLKGDQKAYDLKMDQYQKALALDPK